MEKPLYPYAVVNVPEQVQLSPNTPMEFPHLVLFVKLESGSSQQVTLQYIHNGQIMWSTTITVPSVVHRRDISESPLYFNRIICSQSSTLTINRSEYIYDQNV